MKKIISKSILLTIGVIVLNFVFKIYLSYHISKEKIGIFYTILDMILVASLFFTGYKDSMIKIFSEKKFLMVKSYIFRNYTLMTLFLIPILYWFYEKADRFFPVDWFITFFIVTQISNYYSYLNVAHRNYNSMLFEKSVKAITLIVSFTIYIHFFNMMLSLILAYISQLLMHIFYIYLTSSHIFFIKGVSAEKEIYKSFLKNYILSTITSFFGSISIYLSSIIMLYLYSDNELLSEYQVVAKSIFFALVAVFVHPVTAYTFPELSKFVSQKKYVQIKIVDNQLKKYLFIFIILLIFSMLFTKWAITLIFPEEYKNSYIMLNIMLPMLPFIVYTSFSINIIKSFNRFDIALYIRVIGSFLFFISIIFLYFLDIDAMSIVYGLDISFLGMFGLSYYYKTRLLR